MFSGASLVVVFVLNFSAGIVNRSDVSCSPQHLESTTLAIPIVDYGFRICGGVR